MAAACVQAEMLDVRKKNAEHDKGGKKNIIIKILECIFFVLSKKQSVLSVLGLRIEG